MWAWDVYKNLCNFGIITNLGKNLKRRELPLPNTLLVEIRCAWCCDNALHQPPSGWGRNSTISPWENLKNHKRRPGQLNQEITPSSMQQMLLKNATYKFLINTLLTFNILTSFCPNSKAKFGSFGVGNQGNQEICSAGSPGFPNQFAAAPGPPQGFVAGIHATPGKLTGMTGSGYPNLREDT